MPEPRTFTIALPPGTPTLSLNGRLHWRAQRERARTLRAAAWATAKHDHVPALERAFIRVEYQPPDRRRRDLDNVPCASGKHAIDGIVDAGVLLDDAPPYVTGISYSIGEICKGGRIVLHITEAS